MESMQIVEALKMQPHPEGGYYAETYRHAQTIDLGDGRIRNLTTTIYFLLTGQTRSHFHRLSSDETWFYHYGEIIELFMINQGKTVSYLLGNNLTEGSLPQLLIPANTWFAAHIPSGKNFGLVSCTVSPGFDFEDFELATIKKLEEEGIDTSQIPMEFILRV
jgi:predicted cupin superfamily sugar epimerase